MKRFLGIVVLSIVLLAACSDNTRSAQLKTEHLLKKVRGYRQLR